MKKYSKILINYSTILIASSLIIGCTSLRTSENNSVIFANAPLSIYDNNINQKVYQDFINTFQNEVLIANEATDTEQTSFWKAMVNNHIKNKTNYFLAFNQDFIKNIRFLTSEFNQAVVTGIKFLTLDANFISSKPNLINIKFNLPAMVQELGNKVGTYLIDNAIKSNFSNKIIQISSIKYNSIKAATLVNSFYEGIEQASLENQQYQFNINNWEPTIDASSIVQNAHEGNIIYQNAKRILVEKKVSLIFDPLSLYSDSLLAAFDEVWNENKTQSYIATIDTVNQEKFTVNNNNYLLATITRDFKGIFQSIAKSEFNPDEIQTSWTFTSQYIKK